MFKYNKLVDVGSCLRELKNRIEKRKMSNTFVGVRTFPQTVEKVYRSEVSLLCIIIV
jgi:hypothetical protein